MNSKETVLLLAFCTLTVVVSLLAKKALRPTLKIESALIQPSPAANSRAGETPAKTSTPESINTQGQMEDVTRAIEEDARRAREEALSNEENARKAFGDMEQCLIDTQMPLRATPPPGLSSAEAKEFWQLPLKAQANCVNFARKLAEKFPTLRNEFQVRILHKASREALKLEQSL